MKGRNLKAMREKDGSVVVDFVVRIRIRSPEAQRNLTQKELRDYIADAIDIHRDNALEIGGPGMGHIFAMSPRDFTVQTMGRYMSRNIGAFQLA